MKKKFEVGFEGIAYSESADVWLHTEIAGSSHFPNFQNNKLNPGKGETATLS